MSNMVPGKETDGARAQDTDASVKTQGKSKLKRQGTPTAATAVVSDVAQLPEAGASMQESVAASPSKEEKKQARSAKKTTKQQAVHSEVTDTEAKPRKAKKPKLVRDSFTMPEAEYAKLAQLKRSCLDLGVEVKNSELLRLGLSLVVDMQPTDLTSMLQRVEKLKTGRPPKPAH